MMKKQINEILQKYVKDGAVHGLLIDEILQAVTVKTKAKNPKGVDDLFDIIEANDGIVIARIEDYADNPKVVIEAATWAKISEFRRLQRKERRLDKLRSDLIEAGFSFDKQERLPEFIEKKY